LHGRSNEFFLCDKLLPCFLGLIFYLRSNLLDQLQCSAPLGGGGGHEIESGRIQPVRGGAAGARAQLCANSAIRVEKLCTGVPSSSWLDLVQRRLAAPGWRHRIALSLGRLIAIGKRLAFLVSITFTFRVLGLALQPAPSGQKDHLQVAQKV
jgi:hypothetical protein